MFSLSDVVLERLCRVNSFDLPEEVILFGLRGCLPVNEFDAELRDAHQLIVKDADHVHPRCTIGIWDRKRGKVASFPGSTVPYLDAIIKARSEGGKGVNQIIPALLRFDKGSHPRDPERSHPAFRQAMPFPHQRTADDVDFDADDPVSVDFVGDNLHCAYCQSSEQPYRSSFGCQVVVGFARRPHKPNSQDSGPWPRFRDLAYESGQESFTYILLTGRDAMTAASAPGDSVPARLRFGSKGALVEKVQASLREGGFLEDGVDGDFGLSSMTAVIDCQRAHGLLPDGVVGPNTADLLGLGEEWSRF